MGQESSKKQTFSSFSLKCALFDPLKDVAFLRQFCAQKFGLFLHTFFGAKFELKAARKKKRFFWDIFGTILGHRNFTKMGTLLKIINDNFAADNKNNSVMGVRAYQRQVSTR